MSCVYCGKEVRPDRKGYLWATDPNDGHPIWCETAPGKRHALEASLQPDDRVLVHPLGVYGTVVRLRGEDDVVVLADCATQEVVWKRSEVSKLEAS